MGTPARGVNRGFPLRDRQVGHKPGVPEALVYTARHFRVNTTVGKLTATPDTLRARLNFSGTFGTKRTRILSFLSFLPLPAFKSIAGFPMTEERKHAILFAATLLVARKLMPMLDQKEPTAPTDGLLEHYEWCAIHQASRILDKIDKHWPAEGIATHVRIDQSKEKGPVRKDQPLEG